MHETNIKPRSSEINAAGHIGGTALPVWLEEGCQEFFRNALGGLPWYYFQARLEQDFRHEIFHGEDVAVRTRVKKMGNSSVVLSQEVWQKGLLCVEAVSVVVHIDRSTSKPSTIPESVRKQLSVHLV